MRVALVLPSLKDDRETFSVQDRDGGGGAARLEPRAEQLLEEPDGTLNVRDLEIEMIELHEAFAPWDLTAPCGDQCSPTSRGGPGLTEQVRRFPTLRP